MVQFHFTRLFVAALLAACLPFSGSASLQAQSTPSEADKENTAPAVDLADQQTRLAKKYQQLEMLMLKMAEFDASTNPRRSALLKQAIAQSKDKNIRIQMDLLARLLKDDRLSRAVEEQDQLQDELNSLLQLLLSENRADRNRDEQDRIKKYIQEVTRILRQQRSIQGRTEGGDDPIRLAEAGDVEMGSTAVAQSASAKKKESEKKDSKMILL